MADTKRRVHMLLASIPSCEVSMQMHGHKRGSPVDGPFAETKEWTGCGTLSSREIHNPALRPQIIIARVRAPLLCGPATEWE
jgi:hypothetical protein